MVPVDVVSVLAMPLCGFPESRMGKTGPDCFRNFAAVVFTALFTFPAYDIYFDDEKKKEYYSREEKHLKRGNGNWFVRNLIWLLPILIPILVEGISQLIVYVKG